MMLLLVEDVRQDVSCFVVFLVVFELAAALGTGRCDCQAVQTAP